MSLMIVFKLFIFQVLQEMREKLHLACRLAPSNIIYWEFFYFFHLFDQRRILFSVLISIPFFLIIFFSIGFGSFFSLIPMPASPLHFTRYHKIIIIIFHSSNAADDDDDDFILITLHIET